MFVSKNIFIFNTAPTTPPEGTRTFGLEFKTGKTITVYQELFWGSLTDLNLMCFSYLSLAASIKCHTLFDSGEP